MESVFIEYGDHSEETLREVVECKYDRQLRLEKVKYSRFLFGSKEIEIAVSHDPESGRPLELTRSLYEDGYKVTEEVRRLDVEEEEFKSEGVSSDDSESTGVDETEEVDGIDAASSLSGVSSKSSLADTINPPVPASSSGEQSPPSPRRVTPSATPPNPSAPASSPSKQSPPSPRQVIPSITPLIYTKYWSDNQKNPRQQNDNPPPPASKLTQSPSTVPSRSNSLEPVVPRDLEKKQASKKDKGPSEKKNGWCGQSRGS